MAPMNSQATTLPAPSADAALHRNDEHCSLAITVESGMVKDILPTGSIDVIIVDLDMIENENNLEQQLLKAGLQMESGATIRSIDLNRLVACLVSEYRRPAQKQSSPSPDGKKAV